MTDAATDETPASLDVRALLDPAALGHRVDSPRVVETHISWVLLTGRFAYKIHKPVRLPFLDFTTLEARREDCERELALNRRWAPELYLAVVPVRGTPAAPGIVTGGPVIDYAVKMRQFPERARLDRWIEDQGLDERLLEDLAACVAELHAAAPPAPADAPYGLAPAIRCEVEGNLTVLDTWTGLAPEAPLAEVCAASLADLERLDQDFAARRRNGFVRECHGDLHLENLARIDGNVVPFDGVEFLPAFRFVDVASDLAFLLMDLHARGHEGAARTVLDRYLQRSGDYGALAVLRHYLRYRALVRAKVAAIRAGQRGDEGGAERAAANRLVHLAHALGVPGRAPFLLITHGVSGSGKSHLARRLVPGTGAVCLRSDVERARLFADGPGRYGEAATDATYARLEALAAQALAAGWPVIADATFLEGERRRGFAAVAARSGVAYGILDLSAPEAVLRERVARRARRGDDASQADAAVLAEQLRGDTALDDDERPRTLRLDTRTEPDPAAVLHWIEQLAPESRR